MDTFLEPTVRGLYPVVFICRSSSLALAWHYALESPRCVFATDGADGSPVYVEGEGILMSASIIIRNPRSGK